MMIDSPVAKKMKIQLSTRIKSMLLIFAVLLVTAVAYFPALDNDFTYWDEEEYLLRNPEIRSLSFDGIKKIFTSTVYKTYSPLSVLSFAFEYHFFGYNPAPYHVINLLLHLGVVFLVYVLGLRLGLGNLISLLAALIFGIHPIHVESVVWIVERKDVLYSIFYLASVCTYLKYIDEGGRRYYWWAVAFCTLSILSKAMALSLPIVLLICEWVKARKIDRACLIEKIPFLLIVAGIAGITYAMNARIPGEHPTSALFVWIWTFVFYIEKFFFPVTLLPLYQLPQPVTWTNPEYLFALLFFGAIIALLIFYRSHKWILFAFLFYFFSIFFCLRFDSKVDVSIVADRIMYLPCVGFCFLLGKWAVEKAIALKGKSSRMFMAFIVFLTVIGVLLSIKTSRQCDVWQNAFSLWNHVIKADPTQARAFDNLGAAYLRVGDNNAALEKLKQAASLDSRNYETYNNIGLVYFAKNDFGKAIENFHIALKLNPQYAITYNNLGVALKGMGETSQAGLAFISALRFDPKILEARLNLAQIKVADDHKSEAEKLYFENLAIDPGHWETRFNLLALYLDSSRVHDARKLGENLLKDRLDVQSAMRLGQLFLNYQDLAMAIRCYQKVLMIDHKNKTAYVNLGKILGNEEKFSAAVQLWEQGLKYYPGDQEFLDLIKQADGLMR